jgi:flavin-dependent thymidylate synthase
MRVILAGYNIDRDVIEDLIKTEGSSHRDKVTPETISAAYARISRDPRNVNELRESARNEVEKARKSNRTIIFKMGHHSVAEHAVFNFDIIDVSRLAIEAIEKFRLCSYTEKSQRYIKLDSGYVIPEEIRKSSFAQAFSDLIQQQNECYLKFYEILREKLLSGNRKLKANELTDLENRAKEDARYVTPLATKSQLGMTVNARNLELMLRRFASHSLVEVREIGNLIYEQVIPAAPSIIIFAQANDFDQNTYAELKEYSEKYLSETDVHSFSSDGEVKLLDYTNEGDHRILAALLHTSSMMPYERCFSIIRNMTDQEKILFFRQSLKNMELFDCVLREFEHADIIFELIVSAACFGQLKRHRIATLTAQPYDPSLGVTVPQSFTDAGLNDQFTKIVRVTETLFKQISKETGNESAAYALMNAHRRRVLLKCNLREFYHISRLREDFHAQWDIRNMASKMRSIVSGVFPVTSLLLGGKDRYPEIYKNLYGSAPRISITPELPGERTVDKSKIKI